MKLTSYLCLMEMNDIIYKQALDGIMIQLAAGAELEEIIDENDWLYEKYKVDSPMWLRVQYRKQILTQMIREKKLKKIGIWK